MISHCFQYWGGSTYASLNLVFNCATLSVLWYSKLAGWPSCLKLGYSPAISSVKPATLWSLWSPELHSLSVRSVISLLISALQMIYQASVRLFALPHRSTLSTKVNISYFLIGVCSESLHLAYLSHLLDIALNINRHYRVFWERTCHYVHLLVVSLVYQQQGFFVLSIQ